MKAWQGSPKVWIVNVHGNRKGSVESWNESYQMWNVKIMSGHGKGEIQAFQEVDLRRR